MKVSKFLLASAMLTGMMLASCGGGDTPVESENESTTKSASAPKSSAPRDSVATTYTYSDANAKKTYTLLEGASLEGIVVKEIKTHTINTSANSETDATSKCKAAFNSDGTKVIITLPDKTTKEIAITLDTASAKNTIITPHIQTARQERGLRHHPELDRQGPWIYQGRQDLWRR